jgi:3-(3-hydroxy-phenyl)propionate hydroxylase
VTSATVDVAIVGAGPVGLTLASLLQRLGVSCVVLERSRAPYDLPRAVHLDDEALRTLDAAGVAAALDVRPVDGMSLVDADLRPFVTIDRPARAAGRPASVLMHQPHLEQALRAQAGASLRTGRTVHGLAHGSDDAALTLTDGTRVAARWVVGCDGAGSTLRRLIGMRSTDIAFRQRWLVVDLRVSGRTRHPPRVLQICDPHRPATSVPVGGGRHRFEFRARPDETDAELAARASELVAPLAARLGMGTGAVERAAVYEFRGRVARRFRWGRVLLAGDAAHQMPPFLGQGLCTGLRDVGNLAWKLAYVVDGRATPDLLDTYTRERRPHALRTVRLTAAVGRVISDQRPARAAVRNGAVGLAERLLPTGRLGALDVPPLPIGPLVERGRRPWTRPHAIPGTIDAHLGSFDVGPGRFAVVGCGVRPDTGLPVALRGWWERLGTAFVTAAAPADGDPHICVVRPDGILLGSYTAPGTGTLSPLAPLATRLSGAGGLRATH